LIDLTIAQDKYDKREERIAKKEAENDKNARHSKFKKEAKDPKAAREEAEKE
jgi:hypothetical protein